jgi:hypothetical protein
MHTMSDNEITVAGVRKHVHIIDEETGRAEMRFGEGDRTTVSGYMNDFLKLDDDYQFYGDEVQERYDEEKRRQQRMDDIDARIAEAEAHTAECERVWDAKLKAARSWLASHSDDTKGIRKRDRELKIAELAFKRARHALNGLQDERADIESN